LEFAPARRLLLRDHRRSVAIRTGGPEGVLRRLAPAKRRLDARPEWSVVGHVSGRWAESRRRST
jgi:hypothetical protein